MEEDTVKYKRAHEKLRQRVKKLCACVRERERERERMKKINVEWAKRKRKREIKRVTEKQGGRKGKRYRDTKEKRC
jgi:hypothetical protein